MTCYYCKDKHKIKDCVKLTKERARDKDKDTDITKQYKNKLEDTIQKGSITINEASFTRMPEMTCSMEQLLGNLQLSNSNWLDRYPSQVIVDEVCHGHVIKYKVTVNNIPVHVLYDTGASMSCMAKRFSNTLPINAKLISCNRFIAGARGEVLRLVVKCFV